MNGLDVELDARSARNFGMMCRTYLVNGRREGLPSREMMRQAIQDANSGDNINSVIHAQQTAISARRAGAEG